MGAQRSLQGKRINRSRGQYVGSRRGALTLGAEQLWQQLDQLRALVALCMMQSLLRAMQEFGGEAFGQGFEYDLDVFASGQHLAGAFQFGQTQYSAAVMQILDQRYHGAVIDPMHEGLHACFNDGFGLRYCGLAIFHTGLDHGSEVIDGVEEDVIEASDFGFDIADRKSTRLNSSHVS